MLGDPAGALQEMEDAAARATAMAVVADAPVAQLAALWLLRVAYSVCVRLHNSAAALPHLQDALGPRAWKPTACERSWRNVVPGQRARVARNLNKC
jgi:hypothetical protein